MTPAQLLILKSDIAANTNTIPAGKPWSGSFAGQQIKDLPTSGDANFTIAGWYNDEVPSPFYWVWNSAVSRFEIYHEDSDIPSSWDWTFYKSQSPSEQGAWKEMFMGDAANFGKVNLRVGIGKIFTAGSSVNRDHALAKGRRKSKRIEKLFAIAVTSPPANTGNDGVAGNRGKTTNPDVVVFEGQISGDDIQAARQS